MRSALKHSFRNNAAVRLPALLTLADIFVGALEWMLSIQRPDGSWEGMWGVCFTYGIWFGIDGVIDAGLPPTHPKVTAACAFLIDKQKEDGRLPRTDAYIKEIRVLNRSIHESTLPALFALTLLLPHIAPSLHPFYNHMRLFIVFKRNVDSQELFCPYFDAHCPFDVSRRMGRDFHVMCHTRVSQALSHPLPWFPTSVN